MDSNVNNLTSLPKLQGAGNFTEWKFRIKLIQKVLTATTDSKKKPSAIEMNLKLQSIIVNSLNDKILSHVVHCDTSEEMLDKLEDMYGPKEEDIDILQSDFQNFRNSNDLNMQENVSKLELIRTKIIDLGDMISDSAFKTKLLNSLPRRFSAINAAANLNKKLPLKDLIDALISEDIRLNKENNDKRKPHSAVAMIVSCYSCGNQGHKAFQCTQKKIRSSSNTTATSNSTYSSNKSDKMQDEENKCKYCKEVGHIVRNCPALEKRNNAACKNCHEKGHYSKNCKSESRNKEDAKSKLYAGCIGVTSLVNCFDRNKVDPKLWILDSGCTAHVSNDSSNFELLEPISAELLVGDNKSIDISYSGKIRAKCNNSNLLFSNVLLNKKSPANLISVYKLLKVGWKFKEFTLKKVSIVKDNFEIVAYLDENNLWIVPIEIEIFDSSGTQSSDFSLLSLITWHERFAHQNFEYTKDVLQRFEIKYEDVPKDYKCVDCKKGKAYRQPFKSSDYQAKVVGEMTHSDLMISSTKSLGGNKYALILKDDFSKYRTVYFANTKKDTVDFFEDYFNRVETQTKNKPMRLRTDNGTEEENVEIAELISRRGMIHELTCPFTPEQNARVERDMRTLTEAVTTELIDSNLGKEFWAEALSYVVFTLNRVSKSRVKDKTPYEVFYDRTAFDINHLRPFGSEVIVQIPKEKRRKFDPKGQEGIFVGYPPNTKGYKIYIPKSKVFTVSRNVVFMSKFQNRGEQEDEKLKTEKLDKFVDTEDEYEVQTIELDDDWDDSEKDEYVNLFVLSAPNSFSDIEQLANGEKELWMNAVQKELDSMEKYEVWEPAVPGNGTKVIDTMWVFKTKSTEEGIIAKARLVAKGCQIKDNSNSNYAPVASIVTLRVFLAVVAHRRLVIKQVDVVTAFLNGILKETVYIKPPQGYSNRNVKALKLLRALYGLPQSPRCWFDKLQEILLGLDFSQCITDRCLFIQRSKCYVIIIVYVDDMLIAGENEDQVLEVIAELEKHFTIQVMKNVTSFIGMSVELVNPGLIRIHQSGYIENCAKKYRVNWSAPMKTPMEEKLKLNNLNSINKTLCVKKFQKLLGSLNYVMERSRPDVNFALNLLSRVANQATEELYTYLLRILKYLWFTKDLKMEYTDKENVVVEAYCDATWNSNIDSKSTSGYVIRLYGNLVQFKTRKQSIVALSSTESEYIALAECCRDILVVRNILKEIGVEVNEGCKVWCDNQPAITIAKSEGKPNRTKHIDLKYHFVRDLVDNSIVNLNYITSNKNLADFLTKSVAEPRIKFSLNKLGYI